jgi:lysyl-tRNA synthetase class 2
MTDWQPSARPEMLQARASLLRDIREFFADREVLEVETPLLAGAPVTDPNLQIFKSSGRYLQTSPEYAMKRLLSAGSGPIYQICKAFRQEEAGARHNPEFTMLEWYRPGFGLVELMDEMQSLLTLVLGASPVSRYSYRELFAEFAALDPHSDSEVLMAQRLADVTELNFVPDSRDTWLELLLTHVVEPQLRDRGTVFVYDFPQSQAALARVRDKGNLRVAERFEVYMGGVELANGYAELTDAKELAWRFERDNETLRARGEPERPVDGRLLKAMRSGMPDCAGVALGLDRLLMLQSGCDDIRQVLSFDWARA